MEAEVGARCGARASRLRFGSSSRPPSRLLSFAVHLEKIEQELTEQTEKSIV
jgi:hypothetical protein